MTTISDVATHAGVSIATVSRALSNYGRINPTTREKVLTSVGALHYSPNRSARNLRRNQTGVILILTPNMTNPYYASILTGISDTATLHGSAAFICNTLDDQDRTIAALDRLRQHQADGAILLSTDTDSTWLDDYAADFPLVLCSEFLPGHDIAHVSIDNRAASCDVMRYLLGLEHTRIAHLSADNTYQSTLDRLAGYRESLIAAGITPVPEYVVYGSPDYSFSSGKAAAQALLDLSEPPTAIFCISDTLAMGAVVAAQEAGLRVPDDISITGFDDVAVNEVIRPQLTTLAQPCYALGVTSATALFALIGHEPTPLEHVLDHHLVIRQSSGIKTVRV
ncbi:MAG: LacI family DNA-binding transcriptional regulator [Propionibacteriaceae bacterium]|jgi:DNA-binding LacI/PurR family transcriptional regulator|nr:LacI family DNA-binding transcriptional regulator [Propionibacteriaceae bacterium]